MYDEVLCQTHVATAWRVKQIWKSIKERWSWIKQDLVENFVNNCNNCAIRQLLRKMDLIDLSYNADGEYTYICHVRNILHVFSGLYMVVSILEVEELFNEGIYDEETILEAIDVKDFLKYFN
ncbi:unnamed protein product [Rhizophagus irregularis]|nr:unnamed protein product [Rhizophagus irregularis]CAB4418587.1 unnamed protein product [Rhizophagus irregularis]